jgi:hypothetical protein
MKSYENHCNENGDPGSHEKAKEILFVLQSQLCFVPSAYILYSAGFTGAFVDEQVQKHGAQLTDDARQAFRNKFSDAHNQNNDAVDQYGQW